MILDILLMCLAFNIYQESWGEPIEGQYAVGEVTLTRAELSGRNACEEVFLDKQFSWSNGDEIKRYITNKQAWEQAQKIAGELLVASTSFSNGATHYHADYIRKPKWAYKLCEIVKIGKHIFYKSCEVQK